MADELANEGTAAAGADCATAAEGADLCFRLAREEDIPAVTDLYHYVSDVMIGTPYDCSWRRNMHPSDELIAELVRSGGMMIVLDGSTVMGASGIDHDLGRDYGNLPWIVDATPEETAVIHILTVHPAYRGKGVSRRLLHACLDEARSWGCRTVRLDATTNNAPAIALYESEGFVCLGYGTQDVGPDDNPTIELAVMERAL